MILLFRLLPVVFFVLLALFAWRGWRELPALARVAALLAALVGIWLLRTPGALTAAFLLTWMLASWASARKR
jgi:hypothetical protein